MAINLLIITPLWIGLKKFFSEGIDAVEGMPAFYYPFKTLLASKEVKKIHIILLIKKSVFGKLNLHIPNRFAKKLQVYPFYYSSKKDLFYATPKIITAGFKIVKTCHIDLIGGYGSYSVLASLLSIITRIPNYRRLFGTFLYSEIKNQKWQIFVKHPFSYMSFALPADLVIITNDGTFGDKVFQKIGYKKAKFYYLLNGVNKDHDLILLRGALKQDLKMPYMTYVARIDKWKRQDLAIHTLRYLVKDYGVKINLCIIGQIWDENYFARIKELIRKYDLHSYVTIFTGLDHEEVIAIMKNAKINLFFYDFSNLGNSLLESISLGKPTVAIDENNNLSVIPDHVMIKLTNRNPQFLAMKIKQLLEDHHLMERLSRNSLEFSQKNLRSWEERAQLEKKLILSLIQKRIRE